MSVSRPLLHNQLLAWIGQSYYGDAPLYNVPLAYWFDGPLDLLKFTCAFDLVVRHCDTLRLSIDESDGVFRQVVSPEGSGSCDLMDVSDQPDPLRAARQVLTARAGKVFRPNAPLFDACIVRLSPTRHVWLLNQHHCITDAVTNLRLYDCVRRAYAGESASEIFADQPSFIDYVDYVLARTAPDETRGRPRSEAVEQFAPFGSGAPDDDHRAVRINEPFGRAETQALLARARSAECFLHSEDATLLNLFVAATAILAHKLQGESQVALATPLRNRNVAAFREVPGLMMSMLPVGIGIDSSMTLGELYRGVVASMRHALKNRTEVVANSAERRLYDLVVNLPTHSYPAFAGLPVQVERLCSGAQGEALHLLFHRYNDADNFTFEFTFKTSLFSEAQRQRVIGYFRRIVLALASDLSQRVGELDVLSPQERARLLAWSGRGNPRFPTTTYARDLFRQRRAEAPDSILASTDDRFLSTDYVAQRASQLLDQLDSAEGEHMGLLLDEGPELLIGMVAALEAGLPLVPLSSRNSDERLAAIVQEAAVSVIVTDEHHLPQARALQQTAPEVLRIAQLDAAGEPRPAARWTPGLDDFAYIVCTSGSTGRPKAVPLTHANLSAMLLWTRDHFGLGPHTRTLQTLSFGFDFGVYEVMTTVLSGGVIVFPGREVLLDPKQGRAFLTALCIDNINLTPTLASALFSADPWPNALRTMHLGGEAVTADLVRSIERSAGEGCAINNGYGPTEVTVNSSMTRVRARDLVDDSVSIGFPTANNGLWVVDPQSDLVATEVTGELWITGTGITPGYLDRPAQTALVLRPFAEGGPGARAYATGDRVRHGPDGSLQFLGRVDTQVKVRGFRVEPGEIEAILSSHLAVRDAVVVARGAGAERRLFAYVVPRDSSLTTAQLHAHAQQRLPDYMVPTAFALVDALPVTASGKVDRKALPAIELQPRDAAATVAPRSPDERAVTGILQEALHLDHLGVHDNFFELGGHSLIAATVIARIRESMGIALSLRTVFETPTAEGIAAAVGRTRGTATDRPSLTVLASQESERFEPFPLTPLQQAYCIGRTGDFELSTTAAFFRVQQVEGLDVPRLERAIRALIERHDALRLVVFSDDEQRILPSPPQFVLPVQDLRGLPADAVDAAIEATQREMRDEHRSPRHWPLWEVSVLRLSERQYQVHIRVELLLMDGRSLQTIAAELLRLYVDPGAALPELHLSLRDYVRTVSALRADAEASAADRQYWSHRLAGLPYGPELPLAPGRSLPRQSRFFRRRVRLDAGTWRRLGERAQAHGLPPSATILGAYAACIARWSPNSRFLLTVLSSRRVPAHPEVDRLVGCFTETVLLEVDWSDGSFLERTRRAQAQLWQDLDHALVSGVEVLRDLKRARGTSATILSPVVLANNIGHATRVDYQDPALPPLSPLPMSSSLQTPQVLLDHQIFEFADGSLLLNWDTVDDAFPPGMPEAMLAHYCALLEALAVDAAEWHRVSPGRLSDDQLRERERLNRTTAPPTAHTLFTLFAEQANAHPERVAVLTSEETLTYGQLRKAANALASTLRQRDVRRGELVAVVMEKGWEQVVATLAILQCGGAYMPVSAELPEERLSYLLRHGQVRIALTQPDVAARTPWPGEVAPIVVDASLFARPSEPIEVETDRSDLAYVIYTSGSTGLPKGVMIDHAGAVNTVLDVNRRFGITATDRLFALSELTFDLSVHDIFGSLAAGAALVLPSKAQSRDPAVWCDLMREHRVTVWNSVPALMDLLVDHVERTGERRGLVLRMVMMSGDWIAVPLPDRIRRLWPEAAIISLGGATEASIWSIFYLIGRVDPTWKSVPYGRPLTNQTIHVLDQAFEPCPVWVPGDLYIGGGGVALGYLRDEAKTRASFLVHPVTGERLYRTGDHGRYLPDGDVEFLGRTDQQVKIQGYRIELGEIESALARHPAVRDVVVLARSSGARAGKYLAAYVILHHPVDSADLERAMQERLPRYMVPSVYVFMDTFPLSPNGKVDRLAFPDPHAGPPAAHSAEGPRDEVEREVLTAWRAVLDTGTIGIHDDFFAMGGNSLIALRLLGRIRDRFDRDLTLSSLLEQGTVAKQARIIRDRLEATSSPVVTLRDRGEAPIFCVHPVGGSALCYAELAKSLDGFSVFGIQAVGLRSIPEMASRYLADVVAKRPRGPLAFVGWSMGGAIAYEMARQALDSGASVALVAAIDSAAPGVYRQNLEPAALLAWFARDLAAISGRPMSLRTEGELARFDFDGLYRAATEAGIFAGVTRAEVARIYEVFCVNAEALAAYDPPPCDVPMLLIRGASSRVTSDDAEVGWRRLVGGGLSVVELPGDHYTLVQAPSARSVAAELDKRLSLVTQGASA
ncbi:MAG: amino acid adenylation domain-containing protein [Ramlibacter sp.]|nr:amino acid adenylation domain-containing protein [Ramlibacter sp.]